MYDPPYCAVCGGPFDHVESLDFAGLGDDEEYLKDFAYDSQVLSSDKAAWIGQFRILARSGGRGSFSGTSVSPEADIFVSARGQWEYDEDWFDNAHTWIGPTTEDELNHTPTRYQDFFIIHDRCMNILRRFFDYQAKFPSPNAPKLVKELIVAWCTRQKDVNELSTMYAARGESGSLPSNWAMFSGVEHSHLYFGARRFWTDPWDCVPGYEYLCADPTEESEPEAFLSTYLTHPHPNCDSLSSSSAEQVKSLKDLSLSHNHVIHLPREIYDLVISHLSLKDALSFCSSSQNLSELCDNAFWRLQTMRLHGCWLWELRGPDYLSPDENWKGLLKLLTANRSQIQEGAKPYWHNTFANKSPDNGELSKVPLSLGLRNRQRIWMCLESLGTKTDWEIKALQQKKSRTRGK